MLHKYDLVLPDDSVLMVNVFLVCCVSADSVLCGGLTTLHTIVYKYFVVFQWFSISILSQEDYFCSMNTPYTMCVCVHAYGHVCVLEKVRGHPGFCSSGTVYILF